MKKYVVLITNDYLPSNTMLERYERMINAASMKAYYSNEEDAKETYFRWFMYVTNGFKAFILNTETNEILSKH